METFLRITNNNDDNGANLIFSTFFHLVNVMKRKKPWTEQIFDCVLNRVLAIKSRICIELQNEWGSKNSTAKLKMKNEQPKKT